jgi:hypothetical protein
MVVIISDSCAPQCPLSGVKRTSNCHPVMCSPMSAFDPKRTRAAGLVRKPFTLRPVTLHLSRCLKLTSLKGPNLHGAKHLDNGGRLNMGMRNIMEIFNGRSSRFDDSAQRSASNECVRLIRKLRWIGMDEEAERVLAQLSGWPLRPTETVIAGPWATD